MVLGKLGFGPRTMACLVLFLGSVLFESRAMAQFGPQSTVGAGRVVVSDGFYERFGIHFGIRGRGFYFDNGGPGPVPVFGGFDPNTQGRLGFAGRNGFFNLYAANGSSRSMVSSSAILTLPNGGTGQINSSEIRPFVTGVFPVVGDGSTSLLEERLHRLRNGEKGTLVRRRHDPSIPSDGSSPSDGSGIKSDGDSSARSANSAAGSTRPSSSAERGDLSLSEIRRRQAEEERSNELAVLALRDKASELEERGEFGAARVFYKQAAQRARGALADELRAKLDELTAKAPSRKST